MTSLIGSVPDDWAQVRLAEVCDVLAGPSGARLRLERRTSANIPVVAPQDLRHNRIAENGDGAVAAELAAELSRYRIRHADVVCARTGGLGRQALVSHRQDGWLLGTACLRLRVREQLSPSYLCQYLGHPAVRDWIIRNGAASAVPSLTSKTLGALPVVIPPQEVQATVVEVLDALDEKIVTHEQIVEVTVALRDTAVSLLLTAHR